MSRLVRCLICLASLLLVCLTPVHLAAQAETGRITGRVLDEQGSILPGATVTAMNVDTGVARETETDTSGQFVFANMLPAPYEIKVVLSGFSTAASKIQLTVGATATVEIKLAVGGLEEVVQVVGGQVDINVKTQEIATTISETQLRELPTITRDPYDLVALAGSASDTDPSERGAGFALNGLRSAATNVLLDGAANNDEFTGSVGQTIPLDAVQEFSVISNNFSPQFGRATAGVVNLAVKSGTNRLHGSAYEFFRNEALATNTFDNKARDIEKSPFERHQFGGSVGGPIRRDRAFYFGSVEYIRVRSDFTSVAWVPTQEFLSRTAASTRAFFSQYQLATAINGPLLTRGEIGGAAGGPFASLPADLPVFGQVQRSLPSDAGGGDPQDTLLLVGRVDWSLSPSMNMYVRYALEDEETLAGTVSNSPYAGFDTPNTDKNHSVLGSVTKVWAPNLTTQTKVVVNRLNNSQPLGEAPVTPGLYARSTQTQINGIRIAFPGYLPYSPGSAIPFGGPQNFLQLYEDATWLLGRHDVRFGGSYNYLRDGRAFGAFENSAQTLGQNLNQALDNLVLGELFSFQGAIDPQGRFPGDTITLPVTSPRFDRQNRYHEWALYVNDAWSVAPRLTLNLGLRYEYFGVQHNEDPRLDSNFYYGPGANLFEQIRNGSIQVAPDSPAGGLWRPDRNNFGPRLGFAWDVFGDGRTSLRGGYGIAYERNFGNVTFNVIQNPPNYATVSLIAGRDVPTLPIFTDNAGPLAGTGTTTLPRSSARHVNERIVNAWAHLWSVSAQRELWAGTVASVDYSGSSGVDLYSVEDPNAPGSGAVYLGDANVAERTNRQYSNLNTRNNNGRSRYHALIFGLDSRRLGETGLSMTARYTLGWAKDNLSTTFSDGANNLNLGLMDPFNPDLDYGYADYDIRNRLSIGAIWELPFARDAGGLTKALASGWQIGASLKAQSGSPYTIFDCTNGVARCLRLLEQPGLVREGASDPPSTGDANLFEYLDLSNQAAGVGGYVHPIAGTSDFGPFPSNMTERNIFRRPGRWNVDAIFSKRVPVAGARGLQFRVEVYNLFNHANLFVRDAETDVSAGLTMFAFRGDTGSGDGAPAGDGQRRIQLGVRFDF